MDFITGLPKSDGKEVILVIVDRFTKYAHFLALSHPYKASDVAQNFLESVYKLHGLPCDIISDRDPVFTSKFWQELLGKLEVKLNMSTAYHPQTDGQIERVNQCLENYLRCMVYEKQKHWSRYLALAEWWYNTSYHQAIKMSPFEALYGYSPPQLGLGSIPKSSVEAVDVMLKDRQATLRQLKKNLIQAQERNKQFADKKRSDRKFEEGDWVYLKVQPYRQITVVGRQNQKLSPRYCGPYEVIQKIGTCEYRLNLPEGSMIHPVFHVSQLKARVGDTQAISPRLPLIGPTGQLQIRPLAILARRMVKKKNVAETELLIQWVNQTEEDATWEDYKAIKQQFPEFLLEVEKNLKKGGMSRVGLAIMKGELNFDLVKSSEEEDEIKGRAGNQVNEEAPLQQGPSEITGQVNLDNCNKGPSEKEPEKKVSIITREEANQSVEEFVASLTAREVLG